MRVPVVRQEERGGRERTVRTRRQVQAMQGVLGAVHPAGQSREVAVGVAEPGPVGQHPYSSRESGVDSQQVPRRQAQHQPQGLAHRAAPGPPTSQDSPRARVPERAPRLHRPSLPQAPSRVVHYLLEITYPHVNFAVAEVDLL